MINLPPSASMIGRRIMLGFSIIKAMALGIVETCLGGFPAGRERSAPLLLTTCSQPPARRYPIRQFISCDARLFVIMKTVGNAVLVEPGKGLFHGVAVS